MTQNYECPICFEKIENNINISVSICQHKFHTNCLLLCGSICPICRTNLIQNTITKTKITNLPQRVYTGNRYGAHIQDETIPIRYGANIQDESIPRYSESKIINNISREEQAIYDDIKNIRFNLDSEMTDAMLKKYPEFNVNFIGNNGDTLLRIAIDRFTPSVAQNIINHPKITNKTLSDGFYYIKYINSIKRINANQKKIKKAIKDKLNFIEKYSSPLPPLTKENKSTISFFKNWFSIKRV